MSALAPENVWDYPRPPRLEPVPERLLVRHGGETVAETTAGYRVLETSHPPTYYFPPIDVRADLVPARGATFCEFKGRAAYVDVLVAGPRLPRAAWCYPDPVPAFRTIAGYFCFYPSRFEECRVGDMVATAQASDFYGGWVTANLSGPFKGPPGTMGW
ncbi:MAG: DUF427 domain-containing protein [Paracoccaceae bacterium]